MGQIISANAINNLQVAGVYVYVQPPSAVGTAGIPTSLSGFVGTCSWGQPGALLPFSDSSSLYAQCGSFDSGGLDANSIHPDAVLALPFTQNCYAVRVINGGVASSAQINDSGGSSGIIATAFYEGEEGDNISWSIAGGSNNTASAPTATMTWTRQGYAPEIYPNLPNPSGGGFAAAAIAAVNNGMPGVRGPSKIVILSANGSSTNDFTPSSGSLSGGDNGANVNSGQQIGVDGSGSSRTGIYALRGSGVQQFIACGNVDSTQYNVLSSFAASEGSLAVCALPSGTDTPSAISIKQNANLNSIYAALVNGFVYYTNPSTHNEDFVSPLGLAMGIIASLPPEASPMNKPVGGVGNILATERMRTGPAFSSEEMAQLQGAGIMYLKYGMDRASNLIGFPHGQNSFGVPGSGQDDVAYTRMTNFMAGSIVGRLGPYIGELQSSSKNDATRRNAKASLTTFLQSLQDANRIQWYNVQLDEVLNTAVTIAEGLCLALVQVQYMGIIKYFLVTFQGGQQIGVTFGNVAA